MKLLILFLLAGIAYGIFRFIFGIFKELAEMTVEAWHSGDTESQ
ncbi:MAG: hypothetical protein PHH11_05215 [Methylomonas sp.]|nr:hypothetical protein [Methylomonas sp.]